jgi:transcriptional regulator GlxA family with amidase domain
VTLLAAAGLLDGRPATTHWGVVDRCRAMYPNVHWSAERFVTESDNIFCGGGLYASIDLSLYLVERFCGHEVAVQTAKSLLLETPRIWQATYAAQPPRSAHDDEPVQRAQKWLYAHFREDVDLDDLAARVGMSPRNFARRFKAATGEGPLAYLHRLRIDTARHYLESAHRSVQEISQAIGYEDVAFFRQLFRRHTGTSPREYRARFGPRRAA